MTSSLGVEIEVRFHQNSESKIPYFIFRKILDAINKSVFESEWRELDEIQFEFLEIPPVVFDAARYRIKNYRYSAILIRELKPGSLVVTGVVAGLAIWILQQTLGETLKEAWKESSWHKKIKRFLLQNIESKKLFLSHDITKRIRQAVPSEVYIEDIYYESKEANKIIINVVILINPKDYPPDRNEIL